MSRNRIEVLKLQATLDGATLGTILKYPKKQARVEFTCYCGEVYSKQVGDVVGGKQTGLLCKIHSLERIRRKKILDLIEAASSLDNAIFHKDESIWTRPGRIVFTCFCGVKHSKDQSAIRQRQGMFCKTHTEIKTREKIELTSMKNYGVSHYSKSRVVKENCKASNLEKYGVEYIAHVPSIHEKQHKYKWKKYVMPSGDIRDIQGYEHFAMDELTKLYSEEQIITKRSGIKYVYKGENHYYYPDFVITSLRSLNIIEVKSKHTMYYKHFYERNIAKRDACVSHGYIFEFWIYDKKGNKTIVT